MADEAKRSGLLRSLLRGTLRGIVKLLCFVALVLMWAWTVGALWYASIPFPPLRMFLATLYALGIPAIFIFTKSRTTTVLLLLLGFAASVGWLFTVQPSNHRRWQPNVEELPWAEVTGDMVTLHDIRNTQYRTEDDYEVARETKTYDLDKLEHLWLFVVPFKDNELAAHTILSFEFEGDDFLAISIEVRLEKGESYDLLAGLYKRFEITYVAATERDVIGLRALHRGDRVLMYPIRGETAEARKKLFLGIMTRINELHDRPAFYNTLTGNCTTALVGHVNDIVPGKIPFGVEVLLPGRMDELLYRLHLLDTDLPLEEAREKASIEELASRYVNDPEFSKRIRGR